MKQPFMCGTYPNLYASHFVFLDLFAFIRVIRG